MALTCKPGCYNKVITELLKLNIPTWDTFLLYGPIDILLKFEGLKSLKEFVEKWFNPVRMVCSKEKLIAKTMTYVVVIEGPLYMEEPFAFMFLNTVPSPSRNSARISWRKVFSGDFSK